MSATEQLLEQVKTLTEAEAESMLEWLETKRAKAATTTTNEKPVGAFAAIGWGKKNNLPYKTTDEYMKAIREGEE